MDWSVGSGGSGVLTTDDSDDSDGAGHWCLLLGAGSPVAAASAEMGRSRGRGRAQARWGSGRWAVSVVGISGRGRPGSLGIRVCRALAGDEEARSRARWRRHVFDKTRFYTGGTSGEEKRLEA